MKYLALVFLIGCGPMMPRTSSTPLCITPCGMKYVGNEFNEMPLGMTCERLAYAEWRTLGFLEPVVAFDGRFANACRLVSGYWLQQNSEYAWESTASENLIKGITYCGQREIYVNSDPIEHGPLAHEMSHAIQNCWTHTDSGQGDKKGHEGWTANKIYDATYRYATLEEP